MVIPTYKGAKWIGYTLSALERQTFKNFDVIVIIKPSRDGTERIVENYKHSLKLTMVIQKRGGFIDALNIGLRKAKGEIIAFLDDDAVPFRTWLEQLVRTYKQMRVAGVAGDVIPAIMRDGRLSLIREKGSEVLPKDEVPIGKIGLKLWYRPLEGQEKYLFYITKSGVPHRNVACEKVQGAMKSLLGMGANMSFLRTAVKDFRFSKSMSTTTGYANEQYIGWWLWAKGHNVVLNPKVKVRHIVHGQSLGRFFKGKRVLTVESEIQLFFYRLLPYEKGLSMMHRIVYLAFRTAICVKNVGKDRTYWYRLRGVIHGNILGLAWLISRKIGGSYIPQV